MKDEHEWRSIYIAELFLCLALLLMYGEEWFVYVLIGSIPLLSFIYWWDLRPEDRRVKIEVLNGMAMFWVVLFCLSAMAVFFDLEIRRGQSIIHPWAVLWFSVAHVPVILFSWMFLGIKKR